MQGNKMGLTENIHGFLKDYVIKNNKLPTVPTVCKEFNISQGKMIQHFRYLTKDNVLILNSSRYKIGKNFFSENGKKKEIKELISSITIIAIRIIMAIISIGACILSTWFTTCFFVDYGHGIEISYTLSIIMILFSVMAFEAIIIFYKNKQVGLVFLFSFLWLIVLVFSMFSTVATQYNERIKISNASTAQTASKAIDQKTYNLLLKEEKEIERKMELKEIELTPYLNLMNSFKEKEDRKNKDDKWTYWNASEKIKDINKDIQKLQIDLDEKREEIKKELESLKEKEDKTGVVEGTERETKSFYLWLSEIFDIEIQYVQFWPSTFPAAFIDIIAPLSLAICMFLKKKEGKKEK